jgi:Trk K+ transport system NAD-binding subunit
VLVTSIERGREVIPPTGDTVIRSGDRIMVLGSSDDLSRLKQLASSTS